VEQATSLFWSATCRPEWEGHPVETKTTGPEKSDLVLPPAW